MNKYQTLLLKHIEPFPIQRTQKPMKIQNDMEKAMLVCAKPTASPARIFLRRAAFSRNTPLQTS